MWRGAEKKARIKWEEMTKHLHEGETRVKDPITILDAAKINVFKKLITRERQPWMRWIERELIRIANK